MQKALNSILLLAMLVSTSFLGLPTTAHGATDIINDATLSTNLVSCWSLDEASGTRLDATATNNDLTDNNTVLSTTGIQDLAADFELSNSERLTHADNASLSITGDISIALWVNHETYTTSQRGYVSKWVSSGGNRSYLFFSQDNRLQWQNSNTGSYITQKFVTWTPTVGVWYHIVAVYDASAGSVTFYENGSQLGSTQTGLPTSVFNNATTFALGASEGGGGSFFDGLMDEVAVWDKTLTSGEITDLYNSGAGIPCDAGSPILRRIILTQ